MLKEEISIDNKYQLKRYQLKTNLNRKIDMMIPIEKEWGSKWNEKAPQSLCTI